MSCNNRLKEIVKEYIRIHPDKYERTSACRVRGYINSKPVSIFLDCFDCDVISALDPDNMDDIFELSGANNVSHLIGYSKKIGFVNLRLITKKPKDK